MSAEHPTLMWEAAAHPGRGAELLAWVRAAAAQELGPDARIFRSGDDRVVVIAASGDGTRPRLTADPGDLVRRPPHQWLFDEVTDAQQA